MANVEGLLLAHSQSQPTHGTWDNKHSRQAHLHLQATVLRRGKARTPEPEAPARTCECPESQNKPASADRIVCSAWFPPSPSGAGGTRTDTCRPRSKLHAPSRFTYAFCRDSFPVLWFSLLKAFPSQPQGRCSVELERGYVRSMPGFCKSSMRHHDGCNDDVVIRLFPNCPQLAAEIST